MKPAKYEPRHDWYLADAQLMIRALQRAVWPTGFHVTLGGGVLNHGYSDHDVDIYVLPLNRNANNDAVQIAIRTVLTYEQPISHHNPRYALLPTAAMSSSDIYKYGEGDRRVDVFVVKPQCDVCHVADRLLDKESV